ncbi:MAG: hypothetical protein J6M16_10460 [Clostridia bacterium]|nr:hypothetical protein [Clostridia bacterium]
MISKLKILCLAFFICSLFCSCSSEDEISVLPKGWESTTKITITDDINNMPTDLEPKVINMDETMMYAGFRSCGEAVDKAEIVVYGTVNYVGKTYEAVFTTEFMPDEYITSRYYYTPIEISIIEVIKGEYKENKIIYNALGGTYGNITYDSKVYDTLGYKTGDKILVYLSQSYDEIGYECIGPECVIGEGEDGLSNKPAIGGNKIVNTFEEQVNAAKVAYKALADNEKLSE